MGTTRDRRITWAIEYMQQHLREPIATRDIAAQVHLSPSRFRTLFREQTGLGPAQFLQRLRLRRARLLLERTFLSVHDVMALVGYKDADQFTRDFLQTHGIRPARIPDR